MAFEGSLDGFHDVREIERLGYVLGRAGLHRFIYRLGVRISGNHDYYRLGASVHDEPAKTDPGHARQPGVHKSQMEKARLHQSNGAARAVGTPALELWRERVQQERLNRRLVFYYEDCSFRVLHKRRFKAVRRRGSAFGLAASIHSGKDWDIPLGPTMLRVDYRRKRDVTYSTKVRVGASYLVVS